MFNYGKVRDLKLRIEGLQELLDGRFKIIEQQKEEIRIKNARIDLLTRELEEAKKPKRKRTVRKLKDS